MLKITFYYKKNRLIFDPFVLIFDLFNAAYVVLKEIFNLNV